MSKLKNCFPNSFGIFQKKFYIHTHIYIYMEREYTVYIHAYIHIHIHIHICTYRDMYILYNFRPECLINPEGKTAEPRLLGVTQTSHQRYKAQTHSSENREE